MSATCPRTGQMTEILVDMPICPDMLQSSNMPQMSMKCPWNVHEMSMKCPQIPLMSTECPSERVSRTEFEDVSCRHCPTCPDISCADRVLVLWGGSEDMSSCRQMKLSRPWCMVFATSLITVVLKVIRSPKFLKRLNNARLWDARYLWASINVILIVVCLIKRAHLHYSRGLM
jgi:hypothetical protein